MNIIYLSYSLPRNNTHPKIATLNNDNNIYHQFHDRYLALRKAIRTQKKRFATTRHGSLLTQARILISIALKMVLINQVIHSHQQGG